MKDSTLWIYIHLRRSCLFHSTLAGAVSGQACSKQSFVLMLVFKLSQERALIHHVHTHHADRLGWCLPSLSSDSPEEAVLVLAPKL